MKREIALRCLFGILLLSVCLLSACDRDCTHPTLIQTVTEPTCEGGGHTVNECTLCGYRFLSDQKESLGHDWEETVLAATCTEGGYIMRTCLRCAAEETDTDTAALGHTLNRTVVSPTCTKDGYTLNVCAVCEFSYQSDLVPADGHRYDTLVTDYPTIAKVGTRTQRCSCGDTHTSPLLYSDVFLGATVSNTKVLAKGVDVSRYQHTQDEHGNYQPLKWDAIRQAGFQFAILKAGSTPRTAEGQGSVGGIDPVFEMNYRDAKAAGFSLGVYYYTYATTKEAIQADAELLMSWLDGKQLDYPVYLDLEDESITQLGKEIITELCITFLSSLQENGYYGALYSNHQWLTNYLDIARLTPYFDIWYARYPGNAETSAEQAFQWNSKYGAQMGMWQYAQTGIIDGLTDKGNSICFDFNYVYRDYPSLIKQYGYNGYPLPLQAS